MFELILCERVIELGACVLNCIEVIVFDEDDDGVMAMLRTFEIGEEKRVCACYVVVVDGNCS